MVGTFEEATCKLRSGAGAGHGRSRDEESMCQREEGSTVCLVGRSNLVNLRNRVRAEQVRVEVREVRSGPR